MGYPRLSLDVADSGLMSFHRLGTNFVGFSGRYRLKYGFLFFDQ